MHIFFLDFVSNFSKFYIRFHGGADKSLGHFILTINLPFLESTEDACEDETWEVETCDVETRDDCDEDTADDEDWENLL